MPTQTLMNLTEKIVIFTGEIKYTSGESHGIASDQCGLVWMKGKVPHPMNGFYSRRDLKEMGRRKVIWFPKVSKQGCISLHCSQRMMH